MVVNIVRAIAPGRSVSKRTPASNNVRHRNKEKDEEGKKERRGREERKKRTMRFEILIFPLRNNVKAPVLPSPLDS